MACKVHKQRKRPNSCKDCAAELSCKSAPKPKQNVKPNKETVKAMKEADKIASEKTSRDMLAEISSMEKEVDEMVIKKERPKKEKVINTATPEGSSQKDVPVKSEADYAKDLIDKEKEVIDKYFSEKLIQFKQTISGLSNVSYESLDIPLDKFTVDIMNKLYADKWHLIDFYTGSAARASGFSKDVAIFDRIKAGDYKKTAIEWKKEIK